MYNLTHMWKSESTPKLAEIYGKEFVCRKVVPEILICPWGFRQTAGNGCRSGICASNVCVSLGVGGSVLHGQPYRHQGIFKRQRWRQKSSVWWVQPLSSWCLSLTSPSSPCSSRQLTESKSWRRNFTLYGLCNRFKHRLNYSEAKSRTIADCQQCNSAI